MKTKPIGIIDSGIGGLSIWKSIRNKLPRESTIMISDHKYLPYGTKTHQEIQSRIIAIIQFLLHKNAKLVVVACNTATIAGIDTYRTTFPNLPIIGVVPVIKTASEVSKKHSFVILSTNATAKSPYQQHLIDTFANQCTVVSIPASPLVDLIEQHSSKSKIKSYLFDCLPTALLDSIDCIVLGCTHFPFIRTTLTQHVGTTIRILDSGDAVTRQVKRILAHNNQLSRQKRARQQFITTGNATNVTKIASQLMGEVILYTHEDI